MKKSKKTAYFSHDSNARNDEKIIAIRMRLGAEGYGIYFMILERLRDQGDYIGVVDYNIIAYDLRVSSEKVKSVIEDFGLFNFSEDKKSFFSVSFLERMKQKDLFSEYGKKGGGNPSFKKGEKNPYYDPDVLKDKGVDKGIDKPPLSFEINKESKVKESKVKESKVLAFYDEFKSSSDFEHVCMVNHFSKDSVSQSLETFLKHCEIEYPDYKQFVRHFKNWLVKNPPLKKVSYNPEHAGKIIGRDGKEIKEII
jgi:Domain of unknown function (DUF4373)